jgi:hypothetical protein
VYITFDFFRFIAELKDSFCKTVDLAVNENLEEVDQIQKTETKQLDTYIDQVTTDKLSLVSRLRTSDDIVQNCSDKDILRMSATDSLAVETRLLTLTLKDETDLNSLTSCRFGIGKARRNKNVCWKCK